MVHLTRNTPTTHTPIGRTMNPTLHIDPNIRTPDIRFLDGDNVPTNDPNAVAFLLVRRRLFRLAHMPVPLLH